MIEERLIIVNESTIKEVITSMESSAAIASAITPFQNTDEEINDSMQEMSIDEPVNEAIDVTQHFHVVSAFDLPNLIYDEHSRLFNKSTRKPSLLAEAREKGEMFRERYKLVKQRILRNENFCPPSMQLSDDDSFVQVTTIQIYTLICRGLTFGLDYTYQIIDWS
jgi:DNA polymerase epsilon subunit 2